MINNYMNTELIDKDIKNVREELELIKLSPKLLNLVNIVIKNPTETIANCCKKAGYKGVIPFLNDSPARKYYDLSQKLQRLYDQKQSIITKQDVLKMLKDIAKENAKDRVNALNLICKINGLEAPAKSEVAVKSIIISFEEDKYNVNNKVI